MRAIVLLLLVLATSLQAQRIRRVIPVDGAFCPLEITVDENYSRISIRNITGEFRWTAPMQIRYRTSSIGSSVYETLDMAGVALGRNHATFSSTAYPGTGIRPFRGLVLCRRGFAGLPHMTRVELTPRDWVRLHRLLREYRVSDVILRYIPPHVF